MLYEEFCDGVQENVGRDNYEKIEYIYMNDDRFETKQNIYNFYLENGINGINGLYLKLVEKNKNIESKSGLTRYIENTVLGLYEGSKTLFPSETASHMYSAQSILERVVKNQGIMALLEKDYSA